MPRIDLTGSDPVERPRALWPLLAALAGTLVAWPLYLSLLDWPLIRATAWPLFFLTGIGALAGALYARWDERTWVRLLGSANVVGVVLAAVWFFWLASFPEPDQRARTLTIAPDFQLEDQTGHRVVLSQERSRGPVLLVFYRGAWCPFCVSELKGLNTIQDELKREGVRIMAVSVDDPSHSRQAVDRLDLMFPLLSDRDHEVIEAYGLVHHGGGPRGEDTAIPAQFLIGQDGMVLWRRIAGRLQDRASPEEVLKQVAKHVG